MNINATVFIQALNFGITYYVLKHVLFIPVLKRIQQKDEARDLLLLTLRKKDQKLNELQDVKREKLEEFQMQAKKMYDIDLVVTRESDVAWELQQKEEYQSALIAQMKARLLEKVPHGY